MDVTLQQDGAVITGTALMAMRGRPVVLAVLVLQPAGNLRRVPITDGKIERERSSPFPSSGAWVSARSPWCIPAPWQALPWTEPWPWRVVWARGAHSIQRRQEGGLAWAGLAGFAVGLAFFLCGQGQHRPWPFLVPLPRIPLDLHPARFPFFRPGRVSLRISRPIMRAFLVTVGVWAALLVTVETASSQSIPDWENPSVVGINKEAPRASAFPFETVALAETNDRGQSAYSPTS